MRPWVTLLFVVSVLNSCEAQGTSTVTPVFVKKGDDLILNVDVPEDVLLVAWKFNKTVGVAVFVPGGERSVLPDFTGRIEFPVKQFSVILKNLQEADSGVYAARVTTLQGDQPLTEYKVTVQGPVSPVELTVDSVDSVYRTSDSCNLNVTCSTQHFHISSTVRCVHQTCSQDGGEQPELTTSGASLQVYLLKSSIICNHSNHVNWTEDFNKTENFCPQYAARGSGSYPVPVHVIAICLTIVIPVIFGLLGVFLYRRKRGNYKRESIENTVYEVPQVTTAQPLEQSPTDDASGLSPTSTYSLVGPHSGFQIPTETGGTTLPESLYAQVEKPARSLNN